MNSLSFLPPLILSLLFFCSNISSSELLQVEVKQVNISLNYEIAPRLSQVLIDAYQYTPYKPYRLGSSLINISLKAKQKIHEKKLQLAEILNSVPEKEAQNLSSILNKLRLVNRINLNLDLDAIQLNSKLNPLLEGRYILSLPKRPDYILLIDPFSQQKVIRLALKHGQTFKNYLHDYLISLKGNETRKIESIKQDNSYKKFHIIQADKKMIIPATGYWNNNQYYLSPGAMIFVNLNSNIQKAEQINQQFIELLKYYVAN